MQYLLYIFPKFNPTCQPRLKALGTLLELKIKQILIWVCKDWPFGDCLFLLNKSFSFFLSDLIIFIHTFCFLAALKYVAVYTTDGLHQQKPNSIGVTVNLSTPPNTPKVNITPSSPFPHTVVISPSSPVWSRLPATLSLIPPWAHIVYSLPLKSPRLVSPLGRITPLCAFWHWSRSDR